ncbi:MAG: PilW family protein [Rubrivivax sp.]
MRLLQPNTGRQRRRSAGFTLIELLVALAIGLALVLAITIMLFRYESGRRALTASNDASMGTAYAAYILDRTLRSAGSGYAQSGVTTFGCRLLVARGATTVLPRSAAFPVPFDNVPIAAPMRLAPIVAFAGVGLGGSDVLAVMTGSSGLGETRLEVKPASMTAASLKVSNTAGMRADDLMLVTQRGNPNCMLQQTAAAFAGGASEQIDFGGTYASAAITTPTDTVQLVDMAAGTDRSYVIPVGNTTGNRPLFQLIGVGANATLMAYDLLNVEPTPLTPIVDGVADLRVLYGIDSTGDGRVDRWERPTGATWGAAALLSGPAGTIAQIIAVRVGVLVRTSTPEKDPAAPTTLSLFADLPALRIDRPLGAAEQKLHWRTLDFTVPLRNLMLNPPPPSP